MASSCRTAGGLRVSSNSGTTNIASLRRCTCLASDLQRMRFRRMPGMRGSAIRTLTRIIITSGHLFYGPINIPSHGSTSAAAARTGAAGSTGGRTARRPRAPIARGAIPTWRRSSPTTLPRSGASRVPQALGDTRHGAVHQCTRRLTGPWFHVLRAAH
jgi:hypothetical protein